MPGGIAFEFPQLYFTGLWLTIQISILGLLGALILGTLVAVLRVSPMAPLRWIGAAYVEFFRNTPLVVLLFFLFLGLPLIGLRLDRKSTRLNSSHSQISYAVFCLKKKKQESIPTPR